jgi:hypothetical protein
MHSKASCVTSTAFLLNNLGSSSTNPLQVNRLQGRVGQLLPILALPPTACKPQAAFRAHDGNRSDASRLSVVRPHHTTALWGHINMVFLRNAISGVSLRDVIHTRLTSAGGSLLEAVSSLSMV